MGEFHVCLQIFTIKYTSEIHFVKVSVRYNVTLSLGLAIHQVMIFYPNFQNSAVHSEQTGENSEN